MFKRIVDRSIAAGRIEFVQPTEFFRLLERDIRATSRWGHRASASTATVAIVARSMMG